MFDLVTDALIVTDQASNQSKIAPKHLKMEITWAGPLRAS